jgi:lipopolysaccharide transport system ATP-binding protein
MSDDIAVRLTRVSKMYKLFPTRMENFIDALGLGRCLPFRSVRFQEFWALRGIDLTVKSGSRIGILGRNGAGKTTLLKLITGNLQPTQGTIEVGGRVHALLDLGAGFHPDFTGYENIRASLTYQGLDPSEIDTATNDIEEFAELGDFLRQPYKTYSLGMQARLAFASATAIQPEILIVDEVLGAGDAYFLAKSAERIRRLVDNGSAILLVSHSLDQIVKFCDEAIWLDRGRIVNQGSSLEVVKAYERYIRQLENDRLKAKNRKVLSGSYLPGQEDNYSHSLVLKFHASSDLTVDVSEIVLYRGDEPESHLSVGDAQDTDSSDCAFVILDGGVWSQPKEEALRFFRSLAPGASIHSEGSVAFRSGYLFPETDYAFELKYRCGGSGKFWLTISKDGVSHGRYDLQTSSSGWVSDRVILKRFEEPHMAPIGEQELNSAKVGKGSRWPGERSLTIENVTLLGACGSEQAVFDAGTPLTLTLVAQAHKDGTFSVIAAATLYRTDGVLVSNHVGRQILLELKAGTTRMFSLPFGPLNLGNGSYVFSVALYEFLSPQTARLYDLLDRSYEFQVIGNEPFNNGIFKHNGDWEY